MSKDLEPYRVAVREVFHRRETAGNYGGDVEEFATAMAKVEASARADERERCAKTLADECLRAVSQGEHDEAQILARESQRLRGNYPKVST